MFEVRPGGILTWTFELIRFRQRSSGVVLPDHRCGYALNRAAVTPTPRRQPEMPSVACRSRRRLEVRPIGTVVCELA